MSITPENLIAEEGLAQELAESAELAAAGVFDAPTADEVITALGNASANLLELLDSPTERNVRVETLLKTPQVQALASALHLGARYVEAKAAYNAIVTKGVQAEAKNDTADTASSD